MKINFIKTLIFFTIFTILGSDVSTAARRRTRPAKPRMSASASGLKFPGAAESQVAMLIIDLENGDTLVKENPDLPLTPASITKCVTTAAVLLDGKANEKFKTEALLDGTLSTDGILYGNLLITANGDPTINSRLIPDNENTIDAITNAISRIGIKEIKGKIMVDSIGLFEQGTFSTWGHDDYEWEYGAGYYALNFHDNSFGSERWAYPNPPKAFVDSLRTALISDSIKIVGDDGDFFTLEQIVIYSRESPSALEIMRPLMVESNNMFAESMLRLLARDGYRAHALNRERQLLTDAGLNYKNIKIYDGSGLTRANRISPRFMADLLVLMAKSPYADQYLALFPIAGEEGTVKKVLADSRLSGQFAIKSGSMRKVQCFAGYKLDPDTRKPTHVVVMMLNGFVCSRDDLRKGIAEFLESIF